MTYPRSDSRDALDPRAGDIQPETVPAAEPAGGAHRVVAEPYPVPVAGVPARRAVATALRNASASHASP